MEWLSIYSYIKDQIFNRKKWKKSIKKLAFLQYKNKISNYGQKCTLKGHKIFTC